MSKFKSFGPGWPTARLQATFTYHNPDKSADNPDELRETYETIRACGLDMATKLTQLCPNSPELVRAINSVQESVMLANAAIAIHGLPKVE